MSFTGNKPPARNGSSTLLTSRASSFSGIFKPTVLFPSKGFSKSLTSFILKCKGGIEWGKIIKVLLFLGLLFGFWYLHFGPGFSSMHHHDHKSALKQGRYKYAFLTLLCDDIMAEAAMVLVHSVKRTGTPHDMIVLTMNVSNRTINALQVLGAKIELITEPVAYPFPVTAGRLAINKPCRYSKLLMWNMVQYRKIVYLDSDLLVLNSIDDLFERPAMTAVPDTLPPDKFNSGLMVLEPNRGVFKSMINKVATTLSPNVGDQGFLNSFYPNWYQMSREHHLDYSYNSLVRISTSPVWAQFIGPKLKVLHFSGGTKPWNMMVDKQFPTTRKYDYMWWQVYDDVYYVLGQAAMIRSGNSTFETPPQLTDQCQRDYMAYARGRIVKDKLSIVLNCFDRFNLLAYMVKRYASLDFVYKIYIVWGNVHVTPFHPSYFNVSTPIEILYSGMDSLNDRFKPIRSLETEAILICDDDIEVDAAALRIAFERWKETPQRLVGFFPRAHYRHPDTGQLVYVQAPRQEYSMVLTKMFLLHGEYLRAYTCNVPQQLRDYVDHYKNCEDITMNFLVTQLSGLAPLLVKDTTKMDYGTTSGLSSRGSHDHSRSVCMNDIERMLGYMPLRNSSEMSQHFARVQRWRRQRRPTQAEPGQFQAVLNRSRARFMPSLPFQGHGLVADVAMIPSEDVPGAVLCIQANNPHLSLLNASTHGYALLPYASLPANALQVSGTTFVLHSPSGFEGRFTLLHLLSSFLHWRMDHGCFGPARLILFHHGRLVTQLPPWSAAVIRALLGQNAQPYVPANEKHPECFESAVLARHKGSVHPDACNPLLHTMRNTIHAFCGSLPHHAAAVEILNDHNADVRIAFVGDTSNWLKLEWFNYLSLEAAITHECTHMGLSCQLTKVPRGGFCTVKVLGLSRADILIGPWMDRAMDNIVFLRPGTAVLEVIPPTVHVDDRNVANKETQCLGLKYDQLLNNKGPKPLIAWVRRQLEYVGRKERRYQEEETPSLLEECVSKIIRF